MQTLRLLLLALALAGLLPGLALGGAYKAYSLKVAEGRLTGWWPSPSEELLKLGGITALAGMVYDPENRDLIVVGRATPQLPEISLDDWAVALRAVLVRREFPVVSIDRTPETPQTGKQAVFFKGGVANTAFGRDFLNGDVALKKLSLELLPDGNWGVRSYFNRYRESCRQHPSEDVIGSKFWFYIMGAPNFAVRENVFAIRELQIGVQTQVLYATRNKKPVVDLVGFQDKSGDAFSAEVTEKFLELCARRPELARIKALLDLVSLALGIENLPKDIHLDYWLNRYEVAKVETPPEYDLLKREERLQAVGNLTVVVSVDGGIEMRARILRLKAGDATALKEAVLQSRPGSGALSWEVPIQEWEIPGAVPDPEPEPAPAPPAGPPPPPGPGFSIQGSVRPEGSPPVMYPATFRPAQDAMPVALPKFAAHDSLKPVAGVRMKPQMQKKGVGGGEERDRILKSRPDPESPAWTVPDK